MRPPSGVAEPVRLDRPPETVTGILTCKNPRCISNQEHIKDIHFHLVDAKKNQYACEYCDARTSL